MRKPYLMFALLTFAFAAHADNNMPCSGKKGGIARCDGAKFVCNDGSYSGSKKNCSAENLATTNSGNAFADTQAEFANANPVINAQPAIASTAQPVTASATAAHEKPSTAGHQNLIELNYEGFTVWLDCNQRAPVKFRYNAQHDTGNEAREKDFSFDPNVPKECQQFSSAGYGHGYDRGHQVPANHLDSSPVAIKQSNYMTNILPQTAQMNRGAWLQTEEIIECYRDIDELLVIGGVIWGNNPSDDYFVQSHGVKTPDAFWKVIVRGTGQDERAIAWVVPNSKDATRNHLDSYLVSVDELEKLTGEKIPVADYAKHDKPSASWLIPAGCNKG